jgi:hypothetical protein
LHNKNRKYIRLNFYSVGGAQIYGHGHTLWLPFPPFNCIFFSFCLSCLVTFLSFFPHIFSPFSSLPYIYFLCASCFSSCSPWLFFCLYERLFCLFVCLSVSVCLPLSLEICLAPFYILARVTFSLERRLKPTTNKTKQKKILKKNCDFPKVFKTFQCTLNQLN